MAAQLAHLARAIHASPFQSAAALMSCRTHSATTALLTRTVVSEIRKSRKGPVPCLECTAPPIPADAADPTNAAVHVELTARALEATDAASPAAARSAATTAAAAAAPPPPSPAPAAADPPTSPPASPSC